MTLPSSGKLSLSQIQTEFGGSDPISLTEYYRGGAYTTTNNADVPTSGPIRMGQFNGTVKARLITYIVLGGGGGGGYGVNDGGGSGRAPSGGASYLSSPTIGSQSASGGAGGANGAISRLEFHGGQSSNYGTGGAGGNNNSGGGKASGYGAGGGGGGGDAGGTYDSSGNAGVGGNAGQQISGSAWVPPGETISWAIGGGGSGATGGYPGGSGTGGLVIITNNGAQVVYSGSNGSYVVA